MTKDQIEAIRKHYENYRNHAVFPNLYTEVSALCDLALKGISARAEVGAQWVSVKDRMPEPWVEVLACHIIDDHKREIDIANVDNSGAWVFPWIGRLSKEETAPVWVTHWMPVPAGPDMNKSRSEEK